MGTLQGPVPAQPSSESWRLLVDSVHDYALMMLDASGTITGWNRGAERIHGFRAEDVLGRHLSALYPPPSGHEDAMRDLALAAETGRHALTDWRMRKDGTLLWAHVITTPIRGEQGELLGYGSVTRDLTGPHTAEEALTRSEERLRLLTDAVQDYAIYMLDLEGRVTTWNAGAERIKGYAPREILGRHYAAFFPAEDVAAGAPARELAEALANGHFEQEGYRVRKDGTTFWANVVLTPVRDSRGEVIGFAKVTRDLTHKRASEEALGRSEERLRLLIESVQDYAIYVLDPEGRVSSWNRGAERIKGYRPEEIVGRNYALFFPEEDVRAGKPQQELEIARTAGRFEQEGWRVRKDGGRFWASVVLTPMRDAEGVLVGFAKVTRDLTQRRAAEATERELLREQTARAAAEDAESRLRESERRYRLLSERLSVILNGIADGITVSDPAGNLTFSNRASLHMGRLASSEELSRVVAAGNAGRFAFFDENGVRLSVEELPQHRVHAGQSTATRVVRIVDQVSEREYWCEVRSTAVPDEHGTSAVTVWHDVTENRRREQHERHLASATATLSESLDYHATLASLARTLVPDLSDFCSVHLLEGDALGEVAVAHVDPEQVERAREFGRTYPPDPLAPRGVWNVVRTGKPEVYRNIPDALLQASARSDDHLARLRDSAMKAVLIVPIQAGARVLGTLTLVSVRSAERFDAQEMALVLELGRRAGQAIENARAYAATRAAHDRLELLARAGEALAGAQDYEQVLALVVRHALPMLGDFAFFDVQEGERVRRVALAHGDQALTEALQHTQWVRSERTDVNLCALSSGTSGYHPRIDTAFRQDVATSPEHLALLERSGLCSMVTVPLVGRHGLFGALTVCFGKSGRHHSPDDLRLAEELARRAAVAVERARLHASVQAAAEEAERAARRAEEAAERAELANRVKDEFLATVSHELRTPLNAILGYASLMLGRVEPTFRKAVEVIHRNAQAQAKIIDDILDVSRIVAGKLRLELKTGDMRTIAHDALEAVRPSAEARDITLVFDAPSLPSPILADGERLQQVVWNLLSNAVKFSQPGGHVVMTLRREGCRYQLTVTDSGKGIEPEFLPFVFERFRQAESSTTRRYGGLGLGLAIVRQLVEKHGGTVEAHSEGLGRGATFTVTLPVPAASRPAPGEPDPNLRAQSGRRALEGLKLVVVDDERDARELLQILLEGEGAVVELAASSDAALRVVERFSPDVLVSDIGMGGEDGYALMQRVRRLESPARSVAALALTAYATANDKRRAAEAGFDAHLSKPVDPRDLVATILQLTKGTSQRPPVPKQAD